MKPLIETFNCDPDPLTRRAGSAAAEGNPPRPEPAEWTIMTRSPPLWIVELPRTKLFQMANPAIWGTLWWRACDADTLRRLHAAAKRICLEIGGHEFCRLCHTGGATTRAFWQSALGEDFRFLRWRT